MEEMSEMLDVVLANTVAILKLLNYDVTCDLSMSVNAVAAYEKYCANYEKFKDFPGDSKEEKWNKNRHKPNFVKLLNSLF